MSKYNVSYDFDGYVTYTNIETKEKFIIPIDLEDQIANSAFNSAIDNIVDTIKDWKI